MSDSKKASPRKPDPDDPRLRRSRHLRPAPTIRPRVRQASRRRRAAEPLARPHAAARGGEAARPAEPPPQATAQVIDLDAVRADERRATLAYVAEVHELCALAGRGDLAAGFIAKATPVAQIRRALLEARAAEDEATAIRSQVRPATVEPRAACDRHRGDLRRPQPALPIGGIHARAHRRPVRRRVRRLRG